MHAHWISHCTCIEATFYWTATFRRRLAISNSPEGKVVEGRTLVTVVSLAKTLGYSAPEKDTGRHSPKSDVYSYGVVSCCSLWSVSGNVLSPFKHFFSDCSGNSLGAATLYTHSKGMTQYWYESVIVSIVFIGTRPQGGMILTGRVWRDTVVSQIPGQESLLPICASCTLK